METKIKYLLSFFIIIEIFSSLNCQISFPKDDDNDALQTSSRTVSYGNCLTPSRRSGSCIKVRECRNIWQLVLKQASSKLSNSELAFLRNSQCGDDNGPLVCCESAQILPDTSSIAPVRSAPQTVRRPTTNLLPTQSQCASLSRKILGGRETDLGEFPWMALIEYTKTSEPPGHHCGGSLINNRYVITAAHCIKKINRNWRLSTVRLGEHDTQTNPDCVYDTNNNAECADPHVDIPVEKFIVHQDYDPSSKDQLNDIALLRLSRPVTFTRYIKPICLPVSDYLQSRNLNGIALEVAGWGKTETSLASTKKLKTRVDGVALPTCNQVYSTLKVVIQEKQICAGGAQGIDSCNGDSGGPLIDVDQSSRYYLAGLVSFGPMRCGTTNWPGVYTKIAPFMDWIQQNLEP